MSVFGLQEEGSFELERGVQGEAGYLLCSQCEIYHGPQQLMLYTIYHKRSFALTNLMRTHHMGPSLSRSLDCIQSPGAVILRQQIHARRKEY
jgi:hypothetical protein